MLVMLRGSLGCGLECLFTFSASMAVVEEGVCCTPRYVVFGFLGGGLEGEAEFPWFNETKVSLLFG